MPRPPGGPRRRAPASSPDAPDHADTRRRPRPRPRPGWRPCRRQAARGRRPSTVSPGCGCRSTPGHEVDVERPEHDATRPISDRPAGRAGCRTHRSAISGAVDLERDVDPRRRQAVRVVREVAAPVAAVDDGAAARPGAGELDPHRQHLGVHGIRVDDGARPHRRRRSSRLALANRPWWNAIRRPPSSAAPRPPTAIELAQPRCTSVTDGLVEDVEAVHRDRQPRLGARGEHDRGGLGVVEDVELGRGRGVADVGAAAHEDDPRRSLRRLRVRAQQQGEVGQRGERHERDGASSAAASAARGVAQQVDRVARVGSQGRAAAIPRSAMPSSPCTWRASTGFSSSGRAAPARDRHVGAAGGLEHGEGVAHDVVERGVAADARHGAQVEAGVQRGEEQGAGVVDAGVDVEDDGEAGMVVAWSEPVDPRTTIARAAWPRRRRCATAGLCSTGFGLDAAPRRMPSRARPRRQRGRPRRLDSAARRLAGTTAPAAPALPGARRARPPHVDRGDPHDVPPSSAAPRDGQPPRPAPPRTPPPPPASCAARSSRASTPDQRPASCSWSGSTPTRPASPRRRRRALAPRHVIYLGGWDGADKVRRTTEHLQGLASPGDHRRTSGCSSPPTRRAARCSSCAGDGFTRPLGSAKEQATMSPPALTRATPRGWARELRRGRGQRQPRAGRRHRARRIGTRQRADRPLRPAVRSSDPETVARASPAFLQGMLRRRRRGDGQALPRAGPDPRQHRRHRHRHHRRRARPPTTPTSSPSRRASQAGAALVMVGSAMLQRSSTPACNGDVLGSRSSPTCCAADLGYDGVVITDDVGAAKAVRGHAGGAAGDTVRRRRGRHRAHRATPSAAPAMRAALTAKVAADPAFAAKVEAAGARGSSTSRSGWACSPAPPPQP